MNTGDFLDSEITKRAYLGKHAYDLFLLSGTQVAVIYKQRGLVVPVETSSTLEYLGRHVGLSLADVAKGLGLPHQLVTQRVDKLSRLGLVSKRRDVKDARRSVLKLTIKGRQQAKLLETCMADAAQVYDALYREIGCDLASALVAAINALSVTPLSVRFDAVVGKRRRRGTNTKRSRARTLQREN